MKQEFERRERSLMQMLEQVGLLVGCLGRGGGRP